MSPIWPAVFLAWIAGFVDALGYLALARIFTAHMSGNSAAVGAELGVGNWHEAMIRGLVIPAFVLGIGIGALSEAVVRRSRLRAQLAPAFVLEIGLLVAFLVVTPMAPGATPAAGTLRYFFRVWLLAMAMGIQSATLRRAGGVRVRTTYISGMLTNMAENAVLSLFQSLRWFSVLPQRDRMPPRKPFGRRALMFALIFLAFLIGGICGGFSEVRWGSIALLAPMAGLLMLVVEDLVAPIRRSAS